MLKKSARNPGELRAIVFQTFNSENMQFGRILFVFLLKPRIVAFFKSDEQQSAHYDNHKGGKPFHHDVSSFPYGAQAGDRLMSVNQMVQQAAYQLRLNLFYLIYSK